MDSPQISGLGPTAASPDNRPGKTPLTKSDASTSNLISKFFKISACLSKLFPKKNLSPPEAPTNKQGNISTKLAIHRIIRNKPKQQISKEMLSARKRQFSKPLPPIPKKPPLPGKQAQAKASTPPPLPPRNAPPPLPQRPAQAKASTPPPLPPRNAPPPLPQRPAQAKASTPSHLPSPPPMPESLQKEEASLGEQPINEEEKQVESSLLNQLKKGKSELKPRSREQGSTPSTPKTSFADILAARRRSMGEDQIENTTHGKPTSQDRVGEPEKPPPPPPQSTVSIQQVPQKTTRPSPEDLKQAAKRLKPTKQKEESTAPEERSIQDALAEQLEKINLPPEKKDTREGVADDEWDD